jgi:hypothetical protein
MDAYASTNGEVGKPRLLVRSAEAHLVARRLDEAGAYAETALGLTRARGDRGYEARALRLLGEVFAQGESAARLEAASTYFGDASTLAEELGMRPLLAHCHAGLGSLYARMDCVQLSERHLDTAAAMFRELGMRFWLRELSF